MYDSINLKQSKYAEVTQNRLSAALCHLNKCDISNIFLDYAILE